MSGHLYRWMARCALLAALPSAAAAYTFTLPDYGTPQPLGPSLEDCQDPAFLENAHPYVHGMCTQILGEAAAEILHDARQDGRVQGHYTPAIISGRASADTVYSQRLKDPAPLIPPGFRPPVWLSYELNGPEIESCDEFIYQHTYDYQKYLQMADRADSPREAFEGAFDPDGPGNIGHLYVSTAASISTPMKSMSDHGNLYVQAYDPIMPLYSDLVPDLGVRVFDLPKNDFFALTNAEVRMVRLRNPNLADQIEAGRRYYRVRLDGYRSSRYQNEHPTPWQLHQQLDAALNRVPDAELQILALRRREMQDLLSLRRTLKREGLSDNHYRVRRIDDQILDALAQAEVDGCLDIDPSLDQQAGEYDVNRCDWAPGDLQHQLTAIMTPQIEGLRSRCEAHFPSESAANGYSYRNLRGYRYTSRDNPFAHARNMNTFLYRMRDQARYYLSQFDGPTTDGQGNANLPYTQGAYGDHWTWGKTSLAAAEFEYHAEWGLGDGPVRTVCDVNPQFDVGAEGTAHIFGRSREVVRALAAFDLRRARRQLDMAIFGYDYLRYGWEQAGRADPTYAEATLDPIHFTWDTSRDVEYCQTFTIAAVPITVCAELAGRVGFDFDLAAEAGERRNGVCDPHATADMSVRPFAKVDALGSGAVGVSGLGGGIYVEVSLLDTEVPADLHAELQGSGDLSQIEINVEGQGTLKLSSLSGEIGGFVEFPRICVPFTSKCVGGRVSKDLFSWSKAIDTEYTLYDFDWTLSIDAWRQICDTAGIDCQG